MPQQVESANKVEEQAERPRIAFVELRWLSAYGAQRSMTQLMDLLRADGRYEPVLVTSQPGALAELVAKHGHPIEYLDVPSSLQAFGKKLLRGGAIRKGLRGLRLVATYPRVARFLKGNHFAAVYCNDVRASIFVGAPARLVRLPVIWYLRADVRLGTLTAVSLRIANRVILIADGVQRAFTARERRRFRKKFRTVETGFPHMDGPMSNPLKLEQSPVIMFVGSITPRKGLHVLARAWPAVRAECPKACLAIVGDHRPEDASYANQVARELNAEGGVTWHGYQSSPFTVKNNPHILVLPSQSEGLPRVVVEAMARGLRVVATDVGGNRDVVERAGRGIIVEPEDPDALASAVLTLAFSPDSQQAIEAARNHISTRYSLDRFRREFTSVLDGLDICDDR